jgi:hemolysin activation/secretion protein
MNRDLVMRTPISLREQAQHRLLNIVAMSCLLASLSVMPQQALAAPDAGAILQQLESRPAPALQAPALKTPEVPTPADGPPAGPVVRVNAFRIEGATLLSPQTLQTALTGFVQRDLSLTQLQEAAWVIIQTYRQAGWLVNAFVPQQEIETGVVLIQVLEARLGQVKVEIQPSVRIDAEQIQRMVQAQVQAGQPLNVDAVDRALMLMGELSGVVASGSYAPSQTEGATDVLVLVGGGKPVDVQFSLDNHGARSTGAQRTSLGINFNSVLGLGDQFNVNLINSEGSSYQRAAVSVPVGDQGLRLGMHSSEMHYGFDWNSTAISGMARTWGADVSGALLRSPGQSWSWSVSTDQKQFQNLANEAISSAYRIELARASVSGSWQDSLLSAAQSSLSVSLTSGQVNNPADTTGVDGHFNKLNLSYSREQSLGGSLSAFVQAQSQSASGNLDSSEKLYLGGPSGVRAYPVNEVGGATGFALTTGLRQRLGQGWMASGFADWGRVSVCRSQLQACLRSGQPNVQSLQGLGASMQWQTEPGLTLNATWSHRRGSNPLANAAGQDSDQTRVINRLWLSAAVSF